MWRLTIIASVAVLAIAKPELYKESEDFQYSRSSSDDGTKSGFYGARRGNMGGNYERAHNMDGFAQHQLSTAVRQVDGELGEGAKTRTGSVYTAANSRGIYGSGNYDLSNLKGRNFEEGESLGESLSHSSSMSQNTGHQGQSYSAAQNAGYNNGFTKTSRYNSGYQSGDQYTRNENAHAQEYQANRQYSYGKHEAAGRDYKYYSQGENQAQNQYDYNKSSLQNAYDSNIYGRRVADRPVSVVMRPGYIATIPVIAKAQDTSYNQNSMNSEDEIVLDSNKQQIYVKPANIPKHYESSNSYRKEWEKHNTQPATVVPTETPFQTNSEFYDDSHSLQNAKNQYSTLDTSNAHSSGTNAAHSNSYSANTKSSSLRNSRYKSESQTQGLSSAQSNAYTLGTHNSQQAADPNSFVEDISSKPKSYHSSYSYHKSWERRGDPYVIKPVGGDLSGQTAQKLIDASANQGIFSSQHYGSKYNQAHQSYSQDGIDCDCEDDHIRVARSADPKAYYNDQEQQFGDYHDIGQQVQNKWENLEDLGQHTQNFGQLTQQTQNQWDRIEDLGQQAQNQWENPQDLGQQTQNQWDNLQELGQQTQNKWDNLETLGQQTQDQSDMQQYARQEVQNKWNRLESFDQQVPSDLTAQMQDDKFEQIANEDSIKYIPALNQYTSSDKITPYNQDTRLSKPILNFDTEQHSFDREEKLSFKEDQFLNMFQENKPNTNKYQGKSNIEQSLTFPFYYNENAENKEGTYKTESEDLPYLQSHKTHAISNVNVGNDINSPLQNLWNKLDKIGNLHTYEDSYSQQQYSFSNTQSSYESQDKFNWQHTQRSNDDSQTDLNSLSTNKMGKTITDNPKHHDFTTSRTYTQKPTQPTNKLTTTSKPKFDTQHRIVPQGPVDIGRGDIGAEETLLDNIEIDEMDNIPIPSTSKHYKTQNEIESLSLISENKKMGNLFSQNENNQRQTNKEVRELGEKYDHSVHAHNVQEDTLHTTVKYKKLSYTTPRTFKYLQISDQEKSVNQSGEPVTKKENEEKNQSKEEQKLLSSSGLDVAPVGTEQQNMNEQYENFSQSIEGSLGLGQQQQNDNIQQNEVQKLDDFGKYSNDDKPQKVLSSTGLETAPMDPEQQNMDQQFEDFSQSLQGPLDLGQQQQNSWQSNDNFKQSEVQKLDDFGKYSNDDKPQKVLSSTGLETAPVDPEQLNMDQQFEDFSQSLQGPLDLGQQQQNSWQSNDNFKESEVQKLDDFGKYSNDDKPQKVLSSSGLETAPMDPEQENTDQQFEDFNQMLQGSSDLGQQQQKPWQLYDNLKQSEVQKLDDFSKYSNDEKQHTQDQIVSQLWPQFEGNNQLQSENIFDVETSQPSSEYSKVGKSNEHAPVLEELQRSKIVESQEAVQLKDDTRKATPVELNTEKPGFWKSVGNKFTNAKDSVVSWFKS